MDNRERIQLNLDKVIAKINVAYRRNAISEYYRLHLIADLQNIKQEVNAAFNYQSPADPPEGSPGQEDMKG